jgi:lactoylglutathione lyase
MAIQSFSHVGVCCRDLDASTRFYTEVLGFTELFTVELGPEVQATMEVEGRFRSRMLGREDVLLELLHWLEPQAVGDGARRPMTQLGLTHLCVRVDDVDDLVDAALAAGGTVLRETLSVQEGAGMDGRPVKTMYLLDPDGVRVEVMSGTPDLRALALARLARAAAR